MILHTDRVVLSTNLLFKLDISLSLVTGELLQKTADVTSATYKLHNIEIQRQFICLSTKNYFPTRQAISNNINIVTPQNQGWALVKSLQNIYGKDVLCILQHFLLVPMAQ